MTDHVPVDLYAIDLPADADTDSQPLVVIHGLLGSADNWRSHLKVWQRKRRVVAVDLRNRLEASLSLSLPATLVFDHPDLASLIDHLALLLTNGGDESLDEDALLAGIEQLSDEEAERLLDTRSENEDAS